MCLSLDVNTKGSVFTSIDPPRGSVAPSNENQEMSLPPPPY